MAASRDMGDRWPDDSDGAGRLFRVSQKNSPVAHWSHIEKVTLPTRSWPENPYLIDNAGQSQVFPRKRQRRRIPTFDLGTRLLLGTHKFRLHRPSRDLQTLGRSSGHSLGGPDKNADVRARTRRAAQPVGSSDSSYRVLSLDMLSQVPARCPRSSDKKVGVRTSKRGLGHVVSCPRPRDPVRTPALVGEVPG